MKVVVQRVSEASILIDSKETRSMGRGYVVLLGIGLEDDGEDITWLVSKIAKLRICSDEDGKMNLDIRETGGSILIVSQFTLHASTKKGNRPSFIHAARPDQAVPLYEEFIARVKSEGISVITGEFGADMQVTFVNDGPVTIIMDSKNKV